jgi:hypothetical protein
MNEDWELLDAQEVLTVFGGAPLVWQSQTSTVVEVEGPPLIQPSPPPQAYAMYQHCTHQ